MISGNREQLWFDWQIGSVRVSRIASVCRELDTASCLPASTLEIMTFTSDSLSRVEISQSHVTNVSQFFFSSSSNQRHVRSSKRLTITRDPIPRRMEFLCCALLGKSKNLFDRIHIQPVCTSYFAVRGSAFRLACPMHFYK